MESSDQKQSEWPPLDRRLQFFACGTSLSAETPSYFKSLKGLTIAFALEGARGFRSPKGLGMMPYDGCHMMVFQEELRAAGDNFLKALKAANANEEQIGGQKTFVLQQKAEKDQWTHYFTLPKPNIILAATDRSYLEEVLKRMAMKEKPPNRALPENLGEWQDWANSH